MAGADTIERLRQYLRELTPPARSLLIGELERSLLRGDDVAGADLVLQGLRSVVREQREGAPRIGNSARLFFKPIEPFLVDDRADHKHPGRIARSSLELLWTWIRRDLLPEDAKILADEVNDALLAGDEPRAEHITRAFQDQVAAAIEANFEAAAADGKVHRRMLAQIGTPRPNEDATALKCVLKGRDALASLAAHLPFRIGNLAGDLLDECKALIEASCAHDGELFLYALLIVMSRLAAPWQLVRFGIKAAGSDTAARVAETRYGVAVTIVLAELERMVGELRNDLKSGRGVAVGALLKIIHDCARGCAPNWTCRSTAAGAARSPLSARKLPSCCDLKSIPCPAACGGCCGRARPPKSARTRRSTPATWRRPRRWSNSSAIAVISPASSPSTR